MKNDLTIFKEINLTQFTKEYIATLLWAEFDQRNKRMSKAGKEKAREYCFSFISKVVERFGKETAIKLLYIEGRDFNYLAAHDFWLSAKGHGAGFWDKPQYDEIHEGAGEILHEIAQTFKTDVYIHRGKVDFE